MKLKILFISFVLFGTSSLFSQEVIKIPLNTLSNEWIIFYEDSFLQLSSKESTCTDKAGGPITNKLFVKIQNKSNNNILVNWHYDIYYEEGCRTCNDPNDENLFRFQLSPKQIIIPDCNDYKIGTSGSEDKETLGIFLKYTDSTESSGVVKINLSDFNIYILD